MSDAMTIAAAGMRTATAQFSTAASNIVTATTRPSPAGADGDLPAQFMTMMEARAAFGADAAMFKAADRATGSLLDILA